MDESNFLDDLEMYSPILSEHIKEGSISRRKPPEDYYIDQVIGVCPSCGSDKTNDFYFIDNKSGDSFNSGYCTECGFKWSLECGMPIIENDHHWDLNFYCASSCSIEETIRGSGCPYANNSWGCSQVKAWRDENIVRAMKYATGREEINEDLLEQNRKTLDKRCRLLGN